MAGFGEILVGRYNRYLQKLLSMKGGPVARTLAGDVTAVIQFFHGVENRYLEGWDRFGILDLQTGSVGNRSGVRMRNPAGSNVIAVFERIHIMTSANDIVQMQHATTGLDLLTVFAMPTSVLDPRGRPAPTLIRSRSAGADTPQLTGLEQITLVGNSNDFQLILTDNGEIPLLPGDALQFTNITSNIDLRVSWIWRERFLEDSERA